MERKNEGTPLGTFHQKWKTLRKEHEVREFKRSKKSKTNVSVPVEEDEESPTVPENAEPGNETSIGKKRSVKQPSKAEKKKKKRKVNRQTKEKERIRGILTKGMGGEDFRLSGIELSDDE